jgi:hypothetical protein
MRIMGACLIAAFAIGALASSASAEAPEYGRCKAHAKGNFYSGSCTKAVTPGKGKYEWYPAYIVGPEKLVLPNPGFTLKNEEGKTIIWKTVQGDKIVCTAATGAGAIAHDKEATVSYLTLEGCTSSGGPCTTAGQAPGTIVSNPVEQLATDLGWLSAAEKKVGLDLHNVFGHEDIFEFRCSSGNLARVEIEGVAGQGIAPVVSGKMATTAKLKWTSEKIPQVGNDAAHMVQKPEHFENGSECACFQVTYREEKKIGKKTYFSGDFIGLTMTLVQTYEEPVEVNPVV